MDSLCLCIKINKEIENIKDSLDSVIPHILSYVIIHNGQCPNTVLKVKEYLDENDIIGTVTFCNMTNIRAIMNVTGVWTYILMWELTYVLNGQPNFESIESTYDQILMKTSENISIPIIHRVVAMRNPRTKYEIISDCKINTHGTIKYTKFPGWKFYQGIDSFGGDFGNPIAYNSIEDIYEIANNNPMCIAFNTLGWLKYRVKPKLGNLVSVKGQNKMKEGLYVRDMDELVKPIVDKIMENVNKPIDDMENAITFTITSCKRFKLFKETMDTFLTRCVDIENINRWICIDDNSTESDRDAMIKRYPFFEFIFKNPEEKGHVTSLNMLFNKVKTGWIINWEDDWIILKMFSIKPFIDWIRSQEKITQIILRKIGVQSGKQIVELDGNIISEYIYNKNHKSKPKENKEYDINFPNTNTDNITNDEFGWWWPGFSLNPALTHVSVLKEEIGLFKNNLPQELFEYDYSLRVYEKGYKSVCCNLPIIHTGDVSSYKLNNMNRYYD